MQTRKTIVCALAVVATAFTSFSAMSQEQSADHSKWGKNIITELPPPSAADKAAQAAEDATLGSRVKDMTRSVIELNDKLVKGASYADVAWIMKANPGHEWVTEHSHPFPEVLGFFGSDPDHPEKLNAVVEISIGGEKHILTKSALIYVPKNTKHCPLIIQKVDKPFLFITYGPTTGYAINK